MLEDFDLAFKRDSDELDDAARVRLDAPDREPARRASSAVRRLKWSSKSGTVRLLKRVEDVAEQPAGPHVFEEHDRPPARTTRRSSLKARAAITEQKTSVARPRRTRRRRTAALGAPAHEADARRALRPHTRPMEHLAARLLAHAARARRVERKVRPRPAPISRTRARAATRQGGSPSRASGALRRAHRAVVECGQAVVDGCFSLRLTSA